MCIRDRIKVVAVVFLTYRSSSFPVIALERMRKSKAQSVGLFFVQLTLVVGFLVYLASFTFNFGHMAVLFHVYYVPHKKHRHHHRRQREIKLILTEVEGADPVVTISEPELIQDVTDYKDFPI